MVLWRGRAEEEEGAAAPLNTTVLGARAPFDVGGGIQVEGFEGLLKFRHIEHARVPLIKKVTPGAPTRTINAEAG